MVACFVDECNLDNFTQLFQQMTQPTAAVIILQKFFADILDSHSMEKLLKLGSLKSVAEASLKELAHM